MSKKIAFVCVHNSCRSQMAEAWAKELSSEFTHVYSAGTEKYPKVKTLVVEVMKEVGISMDKNYPKLLSDIPAEVDILVTMGCNIQCPSISSVHTEDWGLEDPSGGLIEGYRQTRDIIEKKVEDLINRIKNNEI